MTKPRVCVLGAGMAGFGAAHRLWEAGVDSILFEKHPYHGGHTASHVFGEGYVFDEGPHISFTKDSRLQALLSESVGGEYETPQAKVNNYWRGHWIPHPAQTNLHGLPVDLVTAIIRDFVAARQQPPAPIQNYADWLVANYGETFARTFPMEYGHRYHTTTADNMNIDWIGPRMYQPTLEEVLRGALSPAAPDVHYVTHFRYPSKGGFVQFLNRFLNESQIRCGHELVELDPKARTLRFANGHVEAYDLLVSSIPLPVLVPLIKGAPSEVRNASDRLACSELVVVNLGFNKPEIIDATWTYFYDREFFMTRLSTPYRQSRHNVPDGHSSVQAECYYSPKYRPLDRHPDECVQPVIDDLLRCGLIADEKEVVFRNTMHIKHANVIFDLECNDARASVHGYLEDIGVRWCGRYGDWEYIWTDQAFLSGERAATMALDSLGTRQV